MQKLYWLWICKWNKARIFFELFFILDWELMNLNDDHEAFDNIKDDDYTWTEPGATTLDQPWTLQ